jgi:type III secretory pathway component EscV
MRISKQLVWANLLALALNAAVLFLGTIKVFPPVLFLAMLAVCLVGLVWASWKISHPSTKRQEPFHSAPTEPVRSIR